MSSTSRMSSTSSMFRCGGSRKKEVEVVKFHKIFRTDLELNQFYKKPKDAYDALKNAVLNDENKRLMVEFVGASLLGISTNISTQFGDLGDELKDAATYLVANQRIMPGVSQKLTKGAVAALTLMSMKKRDNYTDFESMKTNITTQITNCPGVVLKPEHKNKLIVAVQNLKSEDFINNHYLKGSNNVSGFSQPFRARSGYDNRSHDGERETSSQEEERKILEPQQPNSSTNHRNSTEGSAAGRRSRDEEQWLLQNDTTSEDRFKATTPSSTLLFATENSASSNQLSSSQQSGATITTHTTTTTTATNELGKPSGKNTPPPKEAEKPIEIPSNLIEHNLNIEGEGYKTYMYINSSIYAVEDTVFADMIGDINVQTMLRNGEIQLNEFTGGGSVSRSHKLVGFNVVKGSNLSHKIIDVSEVELSNLATQIYKNLKGCDGRGTIVARLSNSPDDFRALLTKYFTNTVLMVSQVQFESLSRQDLTSKNVNLQVLKSHIGVFTNNIRLVVKSTTTTTTTTTPQQPASRISNPNNSSPQNDHKDGIDDDHFDSLDLNDSDAAGEREQVVEQHTVG